MTEDEMVGRHYQLDGHESEQAPGVGDGQGGLACCSPRTFTGAESSHCLAQRMVHPALHGTLTGQSPQTARHSFFDGLFERSEEKIKRE